MSAIRELFELVGEHLAEECTAVPGQAIALVAAEAELKQAEQHAALLASEIRVLNGRLNERDRADAELLEAFKAFAHAPEPVAIRAERTELLIVLGRWAAAKEGK